MTANGKSINGAHANGMKAPSHSIDQFAALESHIASLVEQTRDEESRKRLRKIIMQATAKIETPAETIWKMMLSLHAPTALMVLIKLGVVQDLVSAGQPRTAKLLSESCGGEVLLIVRLMRPLVALGIFGEVDIETYVSTPISKTLMAPPLMGGYQYQFDLAIRSLANMPRYLERTNYRHVDGPYGPFQDCNQTEDGMFTYLTKHPQMMSNFNTFMSASLETRHWFESFPVADIILNGAKSDPAAILLVDIAGGEGHDIAAFHGAFPAAPGALILQDLPAVIDNIKTLNPTITRQKLDFFQPQPVHGARAYYFRKIFHDWPDADCVTILKHTAAAMRKDYSKLLIFEFVLPARNVPLMPALLDINMMALLNGMERTEEQWTTLLSQAGLSIIKVHSTGPDVKSLIEAQLAD